MRHYRVTDGDCFAISLVEDPAIEVDFIALSKQQIPIKLAEEKRLLVGAALIPDIPIYRRFEGQEFYVSFDQSCIEKLAQNFLANYNNITVGHEELVDDVKVVESWIKTSENDKSNDYGFNFPIGTWCIAVKVNNDEIWNKVKSGEYKGFSIEAFVGLDEIINNNIELSMDNKELIDKIKELISGAVEVKMEETPKETETTVELEETPDPKDEEIAKLKEDITNLTAEVERLKSERDELESKLKDSEAMKEEMNVKMSAISKELEESKQEVIKMSKQPSVEPAKQVIAGGKNYGAAVKFMLN